MDISKQRALDERAPSASVRRAPGTGRRAAGVDARRGPSVRVRGHNNQPPPRQRPASPAPALLRGPTSSARNHPDSPSVYRFGPFRGWGGELDFTLD